MKMCNGRSMEFRRKSYCSFCYHFINLCANDTDDSNSTSSVSSNESEENDLDIVESVEQQILYAIVMVGETRGEQILTEKITDYVERVVPGYSRDIFKEHFRIFPETCQEILRIIGTGLNATNSSSGRKPVPAEKQLLIALWFMATPDTYRSVCVTFGVGKATAFRALRRVTYALYCLAPRIIQWPKHQVANQVMEDFNESCGFPNVIGAIDGTHIQIRAPKEDSASYINRKGTHSISLQAVCNSRSLFTHCFAGHVGSVHDSRVFRNSPLARFIELPQEYFPNDSHIIGDAAYPIHPHVMVPFRDNGHLLLKQKNYNYCLSSTRMAIERAFGLLKVRFRILLDCLPLYDGKKIPEFIIACCVLHNICILKNDFMNIVIQRHNEEQLQPIRDVNVALGNEKRNRIMNDLLIRIED